MKHLRFLLSTLGFVFAIAATFASSDAPHFTNVAKGIDSANMCSPEILDEEREIGLSTGECWVQNDGNGLCTVTFQFGNPTVAYIQEGTCFPSELLYIQD